MVACLLDRVFYHKSLMCDVMYIARDQIRMGCFHVEYEMESMNWFMGWLINYMRLGTHDNFMFGWQNMILVWFRT